MRLTATALSLVFACVAELSAQTPGPPPELRLTPGDRIRVEVAADSLRGGEYAVDADGMALMPIVGLLPVAGRPFTDVAAEIRTLFEGELIGPSVRVTPLMRVAVLGEVRAPGLYHVDRTVRLSDAVSMAGGLTQSGRPDDVRLARDGDVFALDDAATTRLVSGDRIIVGRRGFFAENGPLFVGATASVLAALVTSLILR